MVTLDQIQAYMRDQMGDDKERQFVNVSGSSLADALEQASIELALPVKQIEYEILERGNTGLLGVGKKPYLILAYPTSDEQAIEVATQESQIDTSLLSGEGPAMTDGRAFVRLTPDGIMLKVTKPTEGGRRLTDREALERVLERVDEGFDKGRIAKVTKQAAGEFIKVGDFDYDPSNDATLSVELANGEMKAYMMAYPPGPGGADPSYDQIVSFLQMNGVVEGIQEETIQSFVEGPVYRETVLVAEGVEPKDGADATVRYTFDLEPGHVQLKEKNGRVDFKELNLVQNVVEGQVLAKKVPAGRAEPGRTVTGRMLPAKDGRDIEMPIGKNVSLSEDGTVATSDINGQVVISAEKITVEPVHVINGDVNLRTGNVLFLGTVLVKGNVDDGFTVKASGNIEVMGSVGRSNLDAEGDVIVHQGIAGKGEGVIRSGKSIWAKFVENARCESGDLLVVSDGIMSSRVLSDRKVICKGKRASIVGGQVTAVEEINAKTLGSPSGSETILEVGFDPRRKEKLAETERSRDELQQKLDEVQLNMSTIENLARAKRTIPDEKKAFHQELKGQKIELLKEVKRLDDVALELREYLDGLKVNGKISAAGRVHSGVRLTIKDAYLEVRNEFRSVTFVAEKSTVKTIKYEESDEDVTVGRS